MYLGQHIERLSLSGVGRWKFNHQPCSTIYATPAFGKLVLIFIDLVKINL